MIEGMPPASVIERTPQARMIERIERTITKCEKANGGRRAEGFELENETYLEAEADWDWIEIGIEMRYKKRKKKEGTLAID
jgi:hypothetical protein